MMCSFKNAQGITRALRGVWHGRYGTARCPAHEDRLPSLSISNGNDGRLLLYCHAGCSFREIIQALIRIGLLGKQAYAHTLSFSKQFCADLKRVKQKAERAKAIWQQSQPIKKTLADFTFATRAYSQAFEVLIRQAPHNAYFYDLLYFLR